MTVHSPTWHHEISLGTITATLICGACGHPMGAYKVERPKSCACGNLACDQVNAVFKIPEPK